MPAPGSTACEIAEGVLSRFAPHLQAPLRGMCARSKAAVDLLRSFPAAAICLASYTQRGGAHLRNARRLLRDGAPLAQIAEALHLPMWLRRLPPEALHAPLPAELGAYGADRAFARRILNVMPSRFAPGSLWLWQVLGAREAGDDEFALWLGRELSDADKTIASDAMALIAAFAWHSRRPGFVAARYIARPWHADMTLKGAAAETQDWLVRMSLDLSALQAAADESWLVAPHGGGYDFVPLETAADLAEEGRRMGHCAANYAQRVASGASYVFSMRKGERRLATLEVRFPHGSDARPAIVQISARGNRRPGTTVAAAAAAWLERAHPTSLGSRDAQNLGALAWRLFWAPYLACTHNTHVEAFAGAPADPALLARRARKLLAGLAGADARS